MTNKNVDTRWLWWGALAVFVLGGAVAHFSEDFALRYPLDTWRMDLDDLLGNVGTFFVGIAALIGLRRVSKKVVENGAKEKELEQREEYDYQLLRDELERFREHFKEWDGTERRES